MVAHSNVLFSPPYNVETGNPANEAELAAGEVELARHFYIEGLGFGTVYTNIVNSISDDMVDVGAKYEKTGSHVFYRMISADFEDPSTRAQVCMRDLTDTLAARIVATSTELDTYLAYYDKPAYPDSY